MRAELGMDGDIYTVDVAMDLVRHLQDRPEVQRVNVSKREVFNGPNRTALTILLTVDAHRNGRLESYSIYLPVALDEDGQPV